MISFREDQCFAVTGAGSGIGACTAKILLENGARVVGIGRSAEKLEKTRRESAAPERMSAETLDLSADPDSFPAFVSVLREKYGRFSGFVHAAGILNPQPLSIFSVEDALRDFNTNLFSAITLMKGFSSKKNRAENFSAVFVSSISAHTGHPGSLTYCMTKASLNAAVKTLAQELGGQKIRVNSVLPGGCATEMAEKYNTQLPYDYFEKLRESTVFHEVGRPEYIANLIVFLLSPLSYWVQGQNIIADGGETLS